MARFRDCDKSIRGDRHSFLSSESCPCTISSILAAAVAVCGALVSVLAAGGREEERGRMDGREGELDSRRALAGVSLAQGRAGNCAKAYKPGQGLKGGCVR